MGTWRSRGAGRSSMALSIVSVAVLMMSIGRIMVQARPLLKDAEIEAYLNRVNKPAVKSFVSHGDIIDCVDIYKQPALDHPLLKDHKIITAPSFIPNVVKIDNASRLGTFQNNEVCPEGTVPIRRTLKSDLIHAKSLDGYGRRFADAPGYPERSALRVTFRNDEYVGAYGRLNLWGPEVEDNSWSHAVVEVSVDDTTSFIEGGWLVNPSLFGDKKTRLYSYWTTDGYHDTGCYNLLCAGFVQVSTSFAVGGMFPDEDLSVYGGKQTDIQITIVKDKDKGVWWLMLASDGIGYWPINIFKNFEVATTVKYGGAVLNTNNGGRHTTTDMGSGHFVGEGFGKTAYIKDPMIMKDIYHGYHSPSIPSLHPMNDNRNCYSAFFDRTINTLFYGGPGLGADGC